MAEISSLAASLLVLALLVLLVAALYSSVGHGGASGYLAVMALLAVPVVQAAAAALMLNVLVATIAAWSFTRAGCLRPRLLWPMLLVSVPAALIGGLLQVPERTLEWILALVLAYAAVQLLVRPAGGEAAPLHDVRWPALLGAGAGIGMLSGIVGIGGGIFLSPLLILARWASVRQAAALAAWFIVANSSAGIAGRLARGSFDIGPHWPLAIAAVLGGLAGSQLAARFGSARMLRVLLAVVMLAASVKLLAA